MITVSPPSPQVVYVPQYDPVAAYAPPATTAPAPTTAEDKGHSTGSMIATGVLAFGAGILVSEIFEDDDDDGDYWNSQSYGNMWYGPMPYYPAVPVSAEVWRQFLSVQGYNRPNNYARGNNVVVVNQNNNYWNRYDDDRSIETHRREASSPITAAKPSRSDLDRLNADAARGPKRAAPAAADCWKGQGSYTGADPAKRESIEARTDAAKDKARSRRKCRAVMPGRRPPVIAPRQPSPRRMMHWPATSAKLRFSKARGCEAGWSRPRRRTWIVVAPLDAASEPTCRAGRAPRGCQAHGCVRCETGRGRQGASDRGRASAPKAVPPKAKERTRDADTKRRE